MLSNLIICSPSPAVLRHPNIQRYLDGNKLLLHSRASDIMGLTQALIHISDFARQCFINLSFLLLLTMHFCVNHGNGQSMLKMTIPPGEDVEIFTFERLNPVQGPNAVDTFTHQAGLYQLRVLNVSLPMVGIIKSAKGNIRKVFIAPGFPMTLSLDTRQAPGQENISGPWSGIDSVYQRLDASFIQYSNAMYKANAAPEIRLYNELLKNIDSVVPDQYRPLKDFFLYSAMTQAIDSSNEILQLSKVEIAQKTYLDHLAYGTFRSMIDRKFKTKMQLLSSSQQGKLAPTFVLRDSTGNLHRLEDYKGKLVYLDLWASWCMPCRLQTPYMHRMMKRYGQRKDIVFIGIAVGDKLLDWKRAIRQDKPGWLQLYDTNTFVANAYAARSIPRYVLIDKTGNVLDFYAPSPSEPAKLASIIDKALGN